jgi:hypothetical protein
MDRRADPPSDDASSDDALRTEDTTPTPGAVRAVHEATPAAADRARSGQSQRSGLGALASTARSHAMGAASRLRQVARDAARGRGGTGGRLSPRALGLILVAFSVLSLLLGTASSLALLNALDAQAAERDATAHVRAIQTLLQGGGYLQAARLEQTTTHLQALAGDIHRLQTNGLVTLPLADALGAGGIRHTLAMAADLVAAAQAGVDAATILVPLSGAIFADLGNASPSATPVLSAQDLARVSADLATADRYARLALAERAAVHDDDLRRVGLGSLVAQLHQMDALAPQLTTSLGYARTLVGALPALIGLSTPTRYLLLNLDSDELRPGGGFAGNYAVLTLQGGHLQGGLQLHDIYTLDCPHGCPLRRIPDAYSWFDLAPTQFGLRDANLDPDYPQSARLMESVFAQEGGPAVDGVICITPALIEAMLQVTGPITVPEFNRTVNATNLQDVIHYYHLIAGVGLSDTPSGAAYGTSDRKVFDALLGKDLIHAVATLPPDKQRAVGTVVLDAIRTRDVQVYFNNADAQRVLAQLGRDGSLTAPSGGGDSLLVADANIGVTYANADVAEQLADTVTLDAQGTATHAATLTYTYAKRTHLYDAAYVAAGGGYYYRDFVRVIAPAGARQVSGSGCAWRPVTQAQVTAWGCLFTVRAGQTATLHLSWSVPNAVSNAAATGSSGSHTYRLYLQRQAGNLVTAGVTISLPAGAQLKQPVAPPLVAAGTGQAKFAGPLTQSQTLALDYR